MREHVIEAMVMWKLARKTPNDDPTGRMYQLMDKATPEELLEAMKRYGARVTWIEQYMNGVIKI